MADYYDATGAGLTLSTPPSNLWYYFIQGVLGFVHNPGYEGEAPDSIWNFMVRGPAVPDEVKSLDEHLPEKLTRSPYWHRALEAGLRAEIWDELASKAEDTAQVRRYEAKRNLETARYEMYKRKVSAWIGAQTTPARPIRSDV